MYYKSALWTNPILVDDEAGNAIYAINVVYIYD